MRPDPRSLLVCFLAAIVPIAAAAQEPVIPTLGETIEVSIVNVDVIVTDKNGRRVRGLTKDDFRIFENRVPREISNFAEYLSPGADAAGRLAVPPPEAVAVPPVQKRTLVIFIERTKLLPFEADDFIEPIRNTVRSLIRRGDAASVVVWDDATQVRLDFTDDVEAIDTILTAVKKDMIGARRDQSEPLTREVDERAEFDEEAAMYGAMFGVEVPLLDRDIIVEQVGEMHSLNELMRMKRKVHAINATITKMAAGEGKKILLLATHRLGEIAGGDFHYEASSDLLSYETKTRFNTRNIIDSIVRNANGANVTIYPIYPAGRTSRSNVASVTGDINEFAPSIRASHEMTVMNERQSLVKLARETGGIDAVGTADMTHLLRSLEDDVTDYYSLAYRIESGGTDRKRNIVVKTTDPNLVVRSRRSYFEKTDGTRMKDRVLAALVHTANDSMFPIEAELGDSEKRRRSTETMPLQVRIPIAALTMLPQGSANIGAFSVYVAAGTAGEDVSEVTQRTQRFDVPAADLSKALAGHFTFELDVVVNRKSDRLAVGVIDEISKNYAVLRLAVGR